MQGRGYGFLYFRKISDQSYCHFGSLWADGWHQNTSKETPSGECPEESLAAACDGGLQRTNAVGQLTTVPCREGKQVTV